jgi:Protein of unknown function (DUF2800)
MSDHSLLAPSDAERWSRCVGAPHLSRGLPDIDAEYNASGSCSHWILEQCLKSDLDPFQWLGQELQFGHKPLTGEPFKFKIDEERCERIASVTRRIHAEPGQMWTEKKLNTSPVLGVPDQQGHADIIKLDLTGAVEIDGKPHVGVLSVHDFKDGYLTVLAKNNLQGLNYLAAALYEFDLIAPINALRFCIHQPKIHHYDEWTYTREEIETFIAVIRPVAKLVYDIYHGNIDFDPKQHLNAGDEQCFWCPVRGRCPARAQRIIDAFAPLITKYELDDATLAKLYANLDEIEQACKDYRQEALRRVMGGSKLEGQKLVQGKRGKRQWTDKEKAKASLSMVLSPEEMYEPQEIVSPTVAEKRMGKATYETFKDIVTQSPGAYQLAPVGDKRPEVEVPKFGVVPENNLTEQT